MVLTNVSVVEVSEACKDHRDPFMRLGRLLDIGFLVPLHDHDDSGVVAVRGRINGPVLAYCTDARRIGGALSAAGSTHVVQTVDHAVREDCPVIGVWHSASIHRRNSGVDRVVTGQMPSELG